MNDARITRTSAKLGLGYHGLEILLHALGIQKRAGKWSKGGWRRHFDPGESDDAGMCAGLATEGWMHRKSCGGYVVTKAGMAALQLAGWKLVEDGR